MRSFLPEPLSEEDRKLITDAALRAPTGGKMSKFSIIDVRDPARKKRIAEICDHQAFIADAPGVYVYLGDFSRWYRMIYKHVGTLNVDINYPREDEILFSIVDAALAAENMALAAEGIGLGSCFIADIVIKHDEVKELLKLPKYVMPVMLGIFGKPKARPSKPSSRIGVPVVYEDYYRELPDDELADMIMPLIPRTKDGELAMTPDDYITRYYIRRLGSWLSFARTESVKAYFKDWLESPYGE